MWDEISVTIPDSDHAQDIVEAIHRVAVDETEKNTHLAEAEWKRGSHANGLNRINAEPLVNLRPSSSGLQTQIRYVTRASERFEVRNRLYQRIVEVLQRQGKPEPGAVAGASKT